MSSPKRSINIDEKKRINPYAKKNNKFVQPKRKERDMHAIKFN